MLKAGPHVDGDLLTPPLPRSTLDVWQLGPSSDHMILLPVVNEGQLSNEPWAGGAGAGVGTVDMTLLVKQKERWY